MPPIVNEYSNKTRYGMKNDALRYTWAGYYLFVILSSLIGDSTILVASIKYNAIKLHKVIVVTIHHLAVCDLLTIIVQVLPSFVTTIADEELLGHFVCYLLPYAYFYTNTASILLIGTMTTCKLFLLKYPLKYGATSSRKAHKLCGISWVISLLLPVTLLLVDWSDVYFTYVFYECVHGLSSHMWKYLLPLLSLLGPVPVFLVVVTSVYLLVIARQVARRERESLKWQGIVTVILTAAVFCVSWLPMFVILALSKVLYRSEEYDETVSDTAVTLVRIARMFMSLNTISNFYIYCLTVTSFRDFVRSKLLIIYKKFTSTFCGRTIC